MKSYQTTNVRGAWSVRDPHLNDTGPIQCALLNCAIVRRLDLDHPRHNAQPLFNARTSLNVPKLIPNDFYSI